MSFETSALILSWVAILVLAFASAGILRQLQALRGAVTDQNGARSSSPGLRAPLPPELRERAVILFADTECPICHDVLAQFERAAREAELPSSFEVAVMFPDRANGCAPTGVRTYEHQQDVFRSAGVNLLPYGLISREGRVVGASPLSSGDDLRRLFVEAREAGSSEG